MPGDVVGEVLVGILRTVGRVMVEIVGRGLVELIFEIMIKGSGYILLRIFRPKSDPGEGACTIVGIIFWILIGTVAYLIYRATSA